MGFATIGALICYDGCFPETCRILLLHGAEILVGINGRHGQVQHFLVRAAMFQNAASMICTNQAYGAGTMIAQWPTRILAQCPEAKEDYVTADLDLARERDARRHRRDFQQRRPEVYGGILRERPVVEKLESPE